MMHRLSCWQHAHGCRMTFDTWTEAAEHHYREHRRPDPLPTDRAAVIGYAGPEPRRLLTDVRLLALPEALNGTQTGGHDAASPRV
jgi:hypothetical protein